MRAVVAAAAARPKTGNGGGNAEMVRKGRRRENWRRKLVAHDGCFVL